MNIQVLIPDLSSKKRTRTDAMRRSRAPARISHFASNPTQQNADFIASRCVLLFGPIGEKLSRLLRFGRAEHRQTPDRSCTKQACELEGVSRFLGQDRGRGGP